MNSDTQDNTYATDVNPTEQTPEMTLEQAEKLIHDRNEQIVAAAGIKLQEAMDNIRKEFGVNIDFKVSAFISKS